MNGCFSSGLEYRSLAENKLSLCGIGSCTDENIVVPDAVNGAVVVSIDSFAFRREDRIKSISLPSSVDYIGAEAFAWCKNLCSIDLRGVVQISERAFMGCDALSSVSFGSKLEFIGDKAFAYCSNIKSINIPDKVDSLGASAFEGCRSLESVKLSSATKVIENGTFYACTELKSVSMPSTLEYIDEFAFAYCTSLDIENLPIKTILNRYAFFECYTLVS